MDSLYGYDSQTELKLKKLRRHQFRSRLSNDIIQIKKTKQDVSKKDKIQKVWLSQVFTDEGVEHYFGVFRASWELK